MSTKTTFKRIALVAVAALGLGMLSVVPSNATPSPTTGNTTTAVYPWYVTQAQSDTGTAAARTATQVAGANNFVELTAGTTSTSVLSVLKVTGSTFVSESSTTGTLNAAATEIAFVGAVAATDVVTIATPAAGTVTATWYTRAILNGIPADTSVQTITITVSAVKTWSDRYSTATAAGVLVGSTSGVWASGETIYGPKGTLSSTSATSTAVATVTFAFKDSADVALAAVTGEFPAVRATLTQSSPGNLKWTSGSDVAYGRSVTLVTPAQAPVLTVYNDGTAGKATVEIFVGTATTPSFTKTVYFYGAVTSLVAAQGLYVANAAGGAWGCGAATCGSSTVASTPAATITATDALGILVPYLAPKATSSSTTDFSSSTAVAQDAASAGTYNSDVVAVAKGTSGKTASYTWASGTVVSNALTYALGTAMTAVAFTVTPATGIGQAGTMAVALKDASANKPYDSSYDLILKSNLSLTGSIVPSSSTTIDQTQSTTGYIVLNGAGSWTFFNPLVAGEVSLTGSTFGGVAVTAAFTVTNEAVEAANASAQEALDAANAATEAANAATDAADAATAAAQDAADAVAALAVTTQAQIASMRLQNIALSKKIIALTALVNKLLKK
jgi:trimeric autotransporter adhesin